MRYTVTIDVPFSMTVEADTIEAAERQVDALFSDTWDDLATATQNSPFDIHSRYDDTDTQIEYDPDYMCPNCLTPWKCNGPHTPQEETP
jgi:hypothetical protein